MTRIDEDNNNGDGIIEALRISKQALTKVKGNEPRYTITVE